MSTHPDIQVLRVSGRSDPGSVAGAAIRFHEEGKTVEMVAIGVAAVALAVKAVIRTRRFAAPKGWDVSTIPGFREELIDGEERTAIAFRLRFG